jgi:hypothetical protein
VASVSLRSAGRLEAGEAGQLQRGCGVNTEVRIRDVERLSGALQRAARTSGAEKIRNAVALNWLGIMEVDCVEECELSFHFVGFVGLLPLGVVPCVGAKLGPHLKARNHFFKVFSDRA